jgi:hypothetical protein
VNRADIPGADPEPDHRRERNPGPDPVSTLGRAHRLPTPGPSRMVKSVPSSGTSHTKSRVAGTSATSALEGAPIAPRLLSLKAAAAYLGVSPWTVRDLEARRILKRVSVPLSAGAELRKLLFDKVDLDRLIEAWKA